jgi:hypothetical protein
MDIILDNNNDSRQDYEEMIPFFSIASNNFDQDLVILYCIVGGFMMYSLNVILIFQLLLPPNYSHKNKKAATLKIVDTFQDQIKKNGSDARIKMFGDIPIAAGWWYYY